MSEELKSIIINHPVVAAGGSFIPADVVNWVGAAGKRREIVRIRQVLSEMAHDGLIDKLHRNSMGEAATYVRHAPSRRYITAPWRTLTNAEVFDEELLYGITKEEQQAAAWLTTEDEFRARYGWGDSPEEVRAAAGGSTKGGEEGPAGGARPGAPVGADVGSRHPMAGTA